MPRGLVQTEEEEACWEKAKAIASEHFGGEPSGDEEWAYTMGIYKHMCIVRAPAYNPHNYAYLPLGTVLQALPAIRAQRVSVVARSRRGFVAAYRRAKGRPERLEGMQDREGQPWSEVRYNFLKRHLAQMDGDGWQDGAPTRRHLALIAWAYSPTPRRLQGWLASQRGNKSKK